MKLAGGIYVKTTFVVLDIPRAILSVGQLVENGFDLSFTEYGQTLKKDNLEVGIKMLSGMFYLEAHILGEKGCDDHN